MKRIEEVDRPEVGKFYWVPCARLTKPFFSYETGSFVPVLGGWHEDAEIIGFHHHHFHPDFRFVSDGVMRHLAVGYSWDFPKRKRVGTGVFRRVFVSIEPTSEPKRRMLRRLHPTFPSDAPWSRTLEEKYKGAVAKCKICPHRGMPLAGAPVRNGAYVCPGHGLAWDTATLALKPRP